MASNESTPEQAARKTRRRQQRAEGGGERVTWLTCRRLVQVTRIRAALREMFGNRRTAPNTPGCQAHTS